MRRVNEKVDCETKINKNKVIVIPQQEEHNINQFEIAITLYFAKANKGNMRKWNEN